MINKEEEKKQRYWFYKKFVRVTVNFLKFNKLLYLKGKISILKSGHKKGNPLYILLYIYIYHGKWLLHS